MNGSAGAPDRVSSYRWVTVGAWFFSSVSGFMVLNTMGILLPSISSEFHLQPSQQGILVSSAFWGNLALAIPMSWWTSRYRPKVLTMVTLGLGTLFLFLQASAPAFVALLSARLVFGLTILAREPARALLIQQWFPQREVVLVNGVGNALYGLVVGGGLAATPLILGAMGDDWRMMLGIFGTYFAVVTALWTVLGRERVTTEYLKRAVPRETGLLKGALTYRDLWVGGVGFMGASLAMSSFLSFLPTLMLDTHHIPLRWSGIALAIDVVAGGAIGLGVGYVVMLRSNGKLFLKVFGLLMATTYVGMALAASVPLLLALAFLNGTAWGFWPILHTVPFQLPGIRPREVAVALAFTMMMISCGTVLGPLVVGFLQEALGDLRLTLLIIGFAPLSLSVAGTLLRVGSDRVVDTGRSQ
ncbi:MAG: MFS transporter [Chloroflexota bacterium]